MFRKIAISAVSAFALTAGAAFAAGEAESPMGPLVAATPVR